MCDSEDPDWRALLHVADEADRPKTELPDPMLRHRLDADQRLKEGREARRQEREARRLDLGTSESST